ncbi:MAG: hypothetical protein Kow0025_13590 [Thermodesulfovibrionales bacterium]
MTNKAASPLSKAATALAALAALLSACAGGRSIIVEPQRDIPAMEGTYRLIIYGANYLNDLETAAFLDLEGDGIEFAPFAPEFQYRSVEGVSAAEALRTAEAAFEHHTAYLRTYAKRLALPDGRTIGYELRPYYMRLFVGLSDVLDINYSLRDGKLVIFVRLDPRLRDLDGGDDRDHLMEGGGDR